MADARQFGVVVQTGTTGIDANVEWFETEDHARMKAEEWARTSIAIAPAEARIFVVSVLDILQRQVQN